MSAPGLYAALRVDPTPLKEAFLLVKPYADNTSLYEPRAHVTLIYSTQPASAHAFQRASSFLKKIHEIQTRVSKVSLFDNDNGKAVVLELELTDLLWIAHKVLLAQGLTHSFSPYSPHISLGYDVPEDIAQTLVTQLQSFIGTEVVLNSPYVEELKP